MCPSLEELLSVKPVFILATGVFEIKNLETAEHTKNSDTLSSSYKGLRNEKGLCLV